MINAKERMQVLLDQVASGQLSRRRFLAMAGAAGLSAATADQVFAAGENQVNNQARLEGTYDYIVVGAGASGSIVASELSRTGATVLVVESGGPDNSPTVNDEIHAPMGGVRDSGWGRTGPDSLKEFQDVIWINSHSGQRQYPF